jgi:hypothetical protein
MKSTFLELLWGGNAWAIGVDTYKKIDYIMDYGIGGMCDFAFA